MAWINLLEAIYPIGSVYLSTIAISPASTIGGTWKQQTNGCLACAGTAGWAEAGQEGGSGTISVDQMPPHWHNLWNAYNQSGLALWPSDVNGGSAWYVASNANNDGTGGASITTDWDGGGQSSNLCITPFTSILESLNCFYRGDVA